MLLRAMDEYYHTSTAAPLACHESTHTHDIGGVETSARCIINLMIRSYWLQLHCNDGGS